MGSLDVYMIAADNPIGKKQRSILKRKRAGEVLTREQVAAIKMGRKVLRRDMKAQGIKEKSDFELTASSMGLYFDKRRGGMLLLWFFKGRGLWALAGALALMMLTMFMFSAVTQLRGHFTVNMSDDLFREGFVLSDTVWFDMPTTHLFCTPAENVPCVSISHLPEDLDETDGEHHGEYFAYTFYCRNEGESTVDYDWQMRLNSESRNLSSACWVMIFEDGQMTFYAEPNTQTGEAEALPAFDDNTRGYIDFPLRQFAKDPDGQYDTVAEKESFTYSRVIPRTFVSDSVVAEGRQMQVAPGDVHKYTVVIWLEGDDPDCTDELIGGHVGMEFGFELVDDTPEGAAPSRWDKFWDSMRFWEG